MAEPTAPAAAPDVLHREFWTERIQSARRINLLRFCGVSAFFALFVILGGILQLPEWTGNLGLFTVFWVATAVVYYTSRRFDSVAGVATLAIALLDVPMVFLLQWATFPTSNPSGVAGFTLGVYVLLLILAALSLENWYIYFTAVVAAVFEVLLQYLANVSVGGMISTVIVLALAAQTCSYARTRLVELVARVEREITEQRRAEQAMRESERMASLGTLAAGVAHEINTPLTYVVANLALIAERLGTLAVRPGTGAWARGLAGRLSGVEARLEEVRDANRDLVAGVGPQLTGKVRHDFGNAQTFILHSLGKAADELAGVARETHDASLAAGGGPADSIDALLRQAREGAERVRTIVRDLKTFSRSDEASLAAIDPWRPLHTAINLASATLHQRARLRTERGPCPPVMANEGRLGQVFINLLVNAAQAIPPGAPDTQEIRVATGTDEGGRAVIEVRDTGTGIPPEILPRLFDPFFTTKPVGEGTGLGLAICHGIVTALGGELTVESVVGQGSTLRVILPPAEAPLAATAAVEPVAVPAARRGRIALVDDDPGIGLVVREALGADHDLFTLTRASDVLARVVDGERFDLILCDLMMPGMSGMDLYEAVLRHAPEQAPRMLFLTGGAFTPRAERFLREMADRTLDKPFDVFQLRTAVHARLNAQEVA
jgi:signal transduction histidine kinase/CheY-like chemotaxis protein